MYRWDRVLVPMMATSVVPRDVGAGTGGRCIRNMVDLMMWSGRSHRFSSLGKLAMYRFASRPSASTPPVSSGAVPPGAAGAVQAPAPEQLDEEGEDDRAATFDEGGGDGLDELDPQFVHVRTICPASAFHITAPRRGTSARRGATLPLRSAMRIGFLA